MLSCGQRMERWEIVRTDGLVFIATDVVFIETPRNCLQLLTLMRTFTGTKELDFLQQRAIDTRELVLDSAARLLATKSVGDVTVAEIMAVSRVSQGSMFYHFSSKGALVDELVRRQEIRSIQLGEAADLDPAPAVKALISYTLALGQAVVEEPLMQSALKLSTQAIGNPQQIWLRSCESLILRCYTETRQQPGVDSALIARAVVAMVTGPTVLEGPTEDLAQRIKTLWDLLLPGLHLKLEL